MKVQDSNNDTSLEDTQDNSSSDEEHVEIKEKHYKHCKRTPEKKRHAGSESEKNMSIPADEWKAVMEYLK